MSGVVSAFHIGGFCNVSLEARRIRKTPVLFALTLTDGLASCPARPRADMATGVGPIATAYLT